MLPAKTRLAISKTHPVRCYKGDADGAQSQIKGKKCPNNPTRGAYGWEFSPPKGSWDVPSGHWVQVIFPLRSAKPLKVWSANETDVLSERSRISAVTGSAPCGMPRSEARPAPTQTVMAPTKAYLSPAADRHHS